MMTQFEIQHSTIPNSVGQFPPEKTTNLICNLLQLNLKLFKELFRYKHAFNSFQADLNTHLTTIANHQQQQQESNEESNSKTTNNNNNIETLEQTRQKVSDMICEKFLQTCSDLGQPGQLGDENYESSIYSILAIVDDFNNQFQQQKQSISTDYIVDYDNNTNSNQSSSAQSTNDTELKHLSKQIGSFLSQLNKDEKFRRKLLKKLFDKLVNDDDDDDVDDDEEEDYPHQISTNPILVEQSQDTAENFILLHDDDEDNNIEENTNNEQLLLQNKMAQIFHNYETSNHNQLENQDEENQNEDLKNVQINKRMVSKSNYQCKYCLKLFEQITPLIHHQRKYHRNRFGCGRCQQTFRKEYCMRIHLRKNCCFQQSQQNTNTNTNIDPSPSPLILDNNQPRNHVCKWPGCGKTFTRGSYLSNHMMAHSNERNFVCNYPGCPKRYKTQAHLFNHLSLHKKHPSTSTTTDQQDISTSSNINKSKIQQESDSTTNSYHCEYSGCDFLTTNLSLLEQHKFQKHDYREGQEKFQCPYCNITFRKKSSLSNHVKSHSGQYSCSWNGCQFRSHSSVVLSRHMMSHKDYIITKSSNTSEDTGSNNNNNNNNLQQSKQHTLNDEIDELTATTTTTTTTTNNSDVNNGEQEKFTCKLCGKIFSKRASIINHVRSHSGQYSCQWPGCYFASQSKMLFRRHVLAEQHDIESRNILQNISKISSSSGSNLDANSTNQNSNSSILRIQLEKSLNQQQSATNLTKIKEEPIETDGPIITQNLDSGSNMIKNSTAVRIFHCRYPDCSYQTQKRPLYRVHMLKHSEIRKHRCTWPKCGKCFKAKSTLNRHLVRHRQVAYKLQQQLLKRTTTATNNPKLNDKDNQMMVSNETDEQILEPIVQIVQNNNNDNQQQQQQQQQNVELKQPTSSISQSDITTRFKCEKCMVTFGTKSALSNHLISHRKPQFRCRYPGCFYETFRLTILQRHEQLIHYEHQQQQRSVVKSDQPQQQRKIYRCLICQQAFTQWDDLNKHVLMHKTTQQESTNKISIKQQQRFICFWPGCKISFTTRSLLQEHLEQTHQKNSKIVMKMSSNSLPHKSISSSTSTFHNNTKSVLKNHLLMNVQRKNLIQNNNQIQVKTNLQQPQQTNNKTFIIGQSSSSATTSNRLNHPESNEDEEDEDEDEIEDNLIPIETLGLQTNQH